ncbi:MAG TPA: hypothetical protein VJB95_00395 [Candidatus Paceibacterota bacterium]
MNEHFTNKPQEQSGPQRLVRPKGGWGHLDKFGRIPYLINVRLNLDEFVDAGWDDYVRRTDFLTKDLSKKHPASFTLKNLTEKEGHYLEIVMHWNIPKEFEEVVLFHELREAEMLYGDNVKWEESHQLAEKETTEYAQRYLNAEQFERYKKWIESLKEEVK